MLHMQLQDPRHSQETSTSFFPPGSALHISAYPQQASTASLGQLLPQHTDTHRQPHLEGGQFGSIFLQPRPHRVWIQLVQLEGLHSHKVS